MRSSTSAVTRAVEVSQSTTLRRAPHVTNHVYADTPGCHAFSSVHHIVPTVRRCTVTCLVVLSAKQSCRYSPHYWPFNIPYTWNTYTLPKLNPGVRGGHLLGIGGVDGSRPWRFLAVTKMVVKLFLGACVRCHAICGPLRGDLTSLGLGTLACRPQQTPATHGCVNPKRPSDLRAKVSLCPFQYYPPAAVPALAVLDSTRPWWRLCRADGTGRLQLFR